VQQFAGIREALVQALASRYGARLPYLRISRAPPGGADLKSRVIAAMGASALERIAVTSGATCATALLGIYDFTGTEAHYAGRMDGWLRAAPAGSIIMCHPALATEPGDAIGAARAREFAYLSGADFPTALANARVQLVRGGST
ncbi:MAG: ChbG/HpnK family deacetylase, partial [Rhodoferax sp.]|nr:ChbG/HpnK family deacetylase [Rhodoferax sp.]